MVQHHQVLLESETIPVRWTSVEDVEEGVQEIKGWVEEAGSPPDEVIRKYQKLIAGADLYLIDYFYNRLEHEVPEVLFLFIDGYMNESS
ncbi:MAG: hypothetical protein LUO82_03510 [Methanomicrobiales archaeon]|nr:hypothetical protein [Methanomicrobiales archaeon]